LCQGGRIRAETLRGVTREDGAIWPAAEDPDRGGARLDGRGDATFRGGALFGWPGPVERFGGGILRPLPFNCYYKL